MVECVIVCLSGWFVGSLLRLLFGCVIADLFDCVVVWLSV